MSHQTPFILVHHEDDTPCSWPPLEKARENMRQGMLLDGLHIVASLSLRSGFHDLEVEADVACGAEADRVDIEVENRTMHEEPNHIEVFMMKESHWMLSLTGYCRWKLFLLRIRI